MCSLFGFVIFWPNNFGTKAAHKMLKKFTPGIVTVLNPGGYPHQSREFYRGGYRGGHDRGRGHPNPRGRGQPQIRGGLSANIQVQLQPGQHQGYTVPLGYPNQPGQQQQSHQGHYVVYRDGPPQGATFIPAPPPYEEHY